MNDRPRFALRFISGKYQGGEFPLRMNREIIIGRSSDLDMVLVEDMVSRRHAKISSTDGDVYIQDMGSTNGTFVNGEKIAGRAQLHEGDRILVGTGEGSLKAKNTRRDPRVALSIVDGTNPYVEAQIRGRVVERRPDPKFEVKDETAHKYTGKPFPWRNPDAVTLVIEVDRVKFARLPFVHAPGSRPR